MTRLDASRLRYPPGEGWDYSNVGYWHVRRLIKDAVGFDFDFALQQILLRPLGIEGARLALTRDDLSGVEMGEAIRYHPGWVYHGLLVGPLEAAARLLDSLMAGRLIGAAGLESMSRAHPLGGPVTGREWDGPGYGLGLMIGRTRGGVDVRGHTGGGPGSTIAVYHRPETRRTVAVFSTASDPNAAENKALRMLA
jgi:CubicO group peptidase (beta-lactamase class C family)